MRTITNSIGTTYPIALTLGDVRRLQAGVMIEPGRTLLEDFGHSDADKLQEQIDRILTLPLLAVDLLYALLPAAERQQISFASFIGEGLATEVWKPTDLVLATQELAEVVLDFFQGRLAEAAGLRRIIRINSKETQAVILGIETLSDDQFQLATLAGQLKLDPQDFRPIILALNEPASLTVEQAAKQIEALWKRQQNAGLNGGTTSTDSPASPDSETLTASPSESSAAAPPEPSNDPPSAPPPSAPLPDNSNSPSIGN